MYLLGFPAWFILPCLFILGAVVGSFLNVCIYRIPRHERLRDQLGGLLHPPSTCPGCGTRIKLRDNVPILGWLLLLGRCRTCRRWISPRYPIIEFLNGLLFVVVYWFEVPYDFSSTIKDSCLYVPYGPHGFPGSSWLSPHALLHYRYAYHMVLLEALVVATFIDLDLRIIPDGSTLPAMAIGVIGAGVFGQLYLVPLWFQDYSIAGELKRNFPDWLQFLFIGGRVPEWVSLYPHLHGLLVSVVGLIVGGGAVWAVRIIGSWALKQEAMGFGDVILMALIGSFLGWQPALVVFFVAPLCALVVVIGSLLFHREREIPYGPYLSLATLIVILGWKQIWPLGERVFDFGPLFPIAAIFMGALFALSLQLWQGVKQILGFSLYDDEAIEEWTSADQLFHFSGETIDPQHGAWKTDGWPGAASGRGLLHDQQWRSGRSPIGGGNHQPGCQTTPQRRT